MKILLISLNFAPELTGIGKYSGEMVDGLLARGHEVSVVCAPPYYPRWQIQAGHKAGAYRVERPAPGLTVYRCPLWVPRRPGGAARLLHLASFALSSLPVLLWLVMWQPRVVFAVAPALFCAPAAWLTARLAGAKAWLHVQDFEVDAAFSLGLLERPLLRRCAEWAERHLMRRFDVVSTISRRMLQRLAAKGVAPARSEHFPNWIDLSAICPGERSDDLRCSFGIAPSQTVCLFSGTTNRKQGLGVLVEAARLLQHDANLIFVVCGNGDMRPELVAAAQGLANMRFIDLRPASELNKLLNMADMHLLPQLRGAADLVMPSKLAGMLASGRPIVAAVAAGGEIASIVAECGVVVEPECADALARAIAAMASDADHRHRLGAAGRRHAERMLDAQTLFDGLHARLLALDRLQYALPLPAVAEAAVAQGSANRIRAPELL